MLLLRAAQNQKVERTPIWIMRQAGRYLPEYQALRQKVSFMQLCKTPELAIEAAMMPLRRFELDGAIIFSDILVPVEAMGCAVHFTDHGPAIATPISTPAQVQQLHSDGVTDKMSFVYSAITGLKTEVSKSHAVFGFAGAPFTLAAYMVEGKPSNSFVKIRQMLYQQPQLYDQLARKIATTVAAHLQAQISAGADVVQLFDTWAGLLSVEEYRRFALPYQQLALQPLIQQKANCILYVLGGQHLLSEMELSGASILSLDWRCDITAAAQQFRGKKVLQGNLDPAVLFSHDRQEIRQQAKKILAAFPERQGHIFNLGHGIHPQTPIDNVKYLVDVVHGDVT